MQFEFGPGALDMLFTARQDRRNEDYSIYLDGDLCQMSAQKHFLVSHGISVKHNNVYPCIRPCDKKKVFELFWKYKADGWWHYDKYYYELKICTEEEFKQALNHQCEVNEVRRQIERGIGRR